MRIVSPAGAALAAAVLVALGGLPAASVAAPPPPMVTARLQSPPLRSGYVEGEVIVKLREGGGYSAQAVERAHGLTLRRVAPRSNLRIYQVPAGAEAATAAALASEPGVEYAETNARFVALGTPTDPLYLYQWNLPDVQAPAAWDLAGGDGVTVAVVDTGVEASHPDLAGRVLDGWNTLDDNARWADDTGHGTHVAGIVAAVANNDQGVAGLAPRAHILPVKALDQWGGTTSSVAEGIRWAADHGARVINLSLGGETGGRTLQEAVDYAYNRGALVVAAAGNCGDPGNHPACSSYNPPLYPASLEHVISVAATGARDERASYSEFNRFVDLAAPGGNPGTSAALSGFITSTYPLRLASNLGQRGYAAMAGTSMAAPHVSAVAALVLARTPDLSTAALERLLTRTADDLGAAGRDDYFGYGKVNALRAVQAAGKGSGGAPQPARSGWTGAGGNATIANVRLGTTRDGRASLRLRSARSYWLGVSTSSKENSRIVAGDPFAAGGVVPQDGAVWRAEAIDAGRAASRTLVLGSNRKALQWQVAAFALARIPAACWRSGAMDPGLVGKNAASASRALSRSSSAGFREEVARLTSALIKKYSASGTISCSATTASEGAGMVKKSGKWRWTSKASDEISALYRAVRDGLEHLEDTATVMLRFTP